MTKVRELLERITTPDFEITLVAATPGILRKMLLRKREVVQLRELYATGSFSDQQIESFVTELLEAEGSRKRFPYQVALAALATVLEDYFSKLAKEYIENLAGVRASSFSTAAGVARESLAARRLRADNRYRNVYISNAIVLEVGERLEIDRKVVQTKVERGLAAA